MHHEEFRTLLAKLRPVIGEMADAYWLAYLFDPARQKDIEAVAQALAAELLDESYTEKHILLEPPPNDKAKGEYPLGTVIYADKPVCRFGLAEDDLPQHIAVLGRSGAGKTNVGYILVWNLLRKKTPFVLLDWRGNYTHFLNRPEGNDILLFTPGETESLSFNPLNPPGNLNQNQREAYLRDVVSIICTTYLPGHQLLSTRGVEYFFLKALDELHFNSDDKPVTFNDIDHYLGRYKPRSRESDWKSTATNVLYKLTTGPIGRLMNSAGIAAIEDILEKPVILKLDSLGSETDRTLFCQTLLLWLYYYRLAELKSLPSKLKHVLIVEEAHHIFLRRYDNGQSVSDSMLRQFREPGQALVLLDQNPSLMSVQALGNCGTTVCLNLRHADDVEAAGKALTLTREDRDHIGKLPIGQAIVKLPDRWNKPFLVKFPQFPVKRAENPSLAGKRYFRGDSGQRNFQEPPPARSQAILPLLNSDRRKEKNTRIGMKGRSLMLDIAGHPLSVITERYKRLGWSACIGTKVKRDLLERELIEQENINVPNGSVTLLKATEKGRDLLSSWGVETKALAKNASLEHEFHKKLVAEHYRKKGYSVKEEVPIGGGKAVDLVATKDNQRIAIEIETGKSDAVANVKKCKEAGFDTVLSIPTR